MQLEFISTNIESIILYSTITQVILLISLMIIGIKFYQVNKRYRQFMKPNLVDLEELFYSYAREVKDIKLDIEKDREKIADLNKRMSTTLRKTSITRYNAIENVGADLSFALSLLDEKNNGVVLNGIYSRDGSYIYAKPVTKGESTYRLSDEEQEVLNTTLNQH
ncbi:MAG: hypothetical protein BEN19_02105 [Epulopiscium sp. Nuni2H_MBin003]|nr:MAG: hypothetical protein BEN19_02105 [Epulopiscium sp. Nuni2H_MBin003]